MEENKTLSLVLPENWHFLRGDMKGWGFKCKLSNYTITKAAPSLQLIPVCDKSKSNSNNNNTSTHRLCGWTHPASGQVTWVATIIHNELHKVSDGWSSWVGIWYDSTDNTILLMNDN